MGQEPRRKRKWDQPDESLISASISMPGILPATNVRSLVGNLPINPLIANVVHTPIMQQQAAAVIQKLTQPKTQEELVIAREIVINNAEPTVRYKLTRRQTQEEIQKCTGAVVITRGKYRPPNAMPDGDKPLYLHISAGAHLRETAEKIIAVDRAAAMVEDLMKPTSKAFSTSIYLGFDADPSLNIPTRIRGPNDQYVNHIMNETGVAVSLRGRGSGNTDSAKLEGEQPLHLFLSSNNTKALEDAKLLAENLLDTICRECGITRVAPTKVYAAVPPPQNLSAGVQISGVEANSTPSSSAPLTSVAGNGVATSSVATTGVSTAFTYGSVAQQNGLCYSQPSLGNVTSYSGYGGIYPQATPLQQVALALRQTCGLSSTISSATSMANTVAKTSDSASSVKDKQPLQKRKFQELPATSKGTVVPHQAQVPKDLGKPGNISAMPAPKRLAGVSSNGMPPPPPKSMPPPPPLPVMQAKPMSPVLKGHLTTGAPASRSMPPPPPKFNSTPSAHKAGSSSTDDTSRRSKPEIVPETLVKLMEYGEDDDDDPDEAAAQDSNSLRTSTTPKPFWAV